MIIDSDDDGPSAPTAFVDKPEFEDGPGLDSTAFPEFVQTLDLTFGTAATRVAVLPMAPCSAEDAAWGGADILKEKLVFAVACATSDVYVVTLPLTPPSHESKSRPDLYKSLLAGTVGKGVWNETVTLLTGQSRQSDGLAITVVKQKSASERSRSVERSNIRSNPLPRVIVAASSREANGTLRLWDVALDAKPGATKQADPFQTEYLLNPITGIAFNPSHTTQLLATASPSAVRVYDYSIASLPADDTSEGPFPTQGSWLLSLYPLFARASSMSTARKPIVAAEWITRGHAILVLLADGQWGIWDIDGVSPATGAGNSLFKSHSGIRGSAITAFSATGHLEGTSPLRNPGSQKSSSVPGSAGDFVPMTPHTRRDALAASMAGGPERLATVRGGIAVTQLSSARGIGSGPPDESAILWLGGADPIVAVIPVISRFWDAQLKRGVGGGVNLFSGAQPTRMLRLTDLGAGLLGERCTGASAVARLGRSRQASARDSTPTGDGALPEGLPVEVILQGESRLVVVRESEDGTPLMNRLVGSRIKKPRATERHASAIVAFPRPDKPSSVAFNLSVSRRGLLRSQRQQRPGLSGAFDDPSNDVLPSTEMDLADASESPVRLSKSRGAGFAFASELDTAADQPDDESDAAERDVEQEMMDIMEIDRELDQMENERELGTKHVFFEG
jgi:hypothetical protein